MEIKAPRGTNDILPSNSYKWRYVEKVVGEIASLYGFKEIRFPTFEHTELFERGVGDTTDIVQKEMYTFKDKSDRSLTLRPEGTASAARLCLENGLFGGLLPLKLYYIISAFRYEKPQAGRFREFHQFGVELYGSDSYMSDVEVICLANEMINQLKLKDIVLKINSIGCPECRAKYHNALREYFKKNEDELCGTCKDRLERNPMRILDCKSPVCSAIVKNSPVILDFICENCSEHFDGVKKGLDAVGIEYIIDPKIVRGLDYYSKTVFELIYKEDGLTVLGGGRYDGLIKELDEKQDICGLGFATGLERIISVMDKQNCDFGEVPGIDLYIANIGEKGLPRAVILAKELREAGFCAENDLMGKSLKAQMKYADKIGAAYSIVLGDNEVQTNIGVLKNMQTGENIEIKLSDIIQIMKN